MTWDSDPDEEYQETLDKAKSIMKALRDIMKNNVGFDSSLSKFGIGLFETIRVKNGIAIDLNIHIERMISSINCLDLDINYKKIS